MNNNDQQLKNKYDNWVAPEKKNARIYFGKEVQDAIVDYNSTANENIRNKIYHLVIHKAFDKLSENIINTFKFTYFDYPFADIKHEVVAFLVMNMHKYDHTKGSKAFSYFSVVAKNYLILHNNNNYKMLKMHDHIDTIKHNMQQEQVDLTDFMMCLSKYFDLLVKSSAKAGLP